MSQCMTTRYGRMCVVACEGKKGKKLADLGGLGGLLLRSFGTLAGGGVQNANVGAERERVLRGSVYGRHLYLQFLMHSTPQPPNVTVLRKISLPCKKTDAVFIAPITVTPRWRGCKCISPPCTRHLRQA